MAESQAAANARAVYASIVMDVATGRVMHAHQADSPRKAGGLAKLMTAYLTFSHEHAGEIGFADRVRISASAAARSSVDAGAPLEAGQSLRLDQLVRRLLGHDGGGAALALAERLAGTREVFVEAMGHSGAQLGLSRSRFADPAGHKADTASARDMGRLARALVQEFPTSLPLLGPDAAHNQPPITWPGGAAGLLRTRTDSAAHGVFVMQREGAGLIAVVLGAPTARARDDHALELMDRAFAILAARQRAAPGDPSTVRGATLALAFGPQATPRLASAPQDGEDQDDDARDNDGAEDDGAENEERIRIIIEGEENDPHGSRRDRTVPSVPSRDRPSPTPHSGGVDALSYAVQVGAYADQARAEQRLANVAAQWPESFADANGYAVPALVNDAPIWRARFYDFTDARARAACQIVRAAGEGCLVLAIMAAERAELPAPD